MTDVGALKNFVDTQDVSLTNTTDSKTYLQLTDVVFDIDSDLEKNQLTDDTIDNVFSVRMNSIEGNLQVTTTEWADLVTLTRDDNAIRPVKSWEVKWSDGTGTTASTTFNGQLKTLSPIDSGLGSITLFFRIEADEIATVVTVVPS